MTSVISRPILFSGPMVQAILDGRKSQTRRGLNRLLRFGKIHDFGKSTTPGYDWHFRDRDGRFHDLRDAELRKYLPPGMLLWVRESFAIESNEEYRDMWKPPSDGRPIRTVDDEDRGEWEQIPHYRATDGEPHIVTYEQDANDDRTRWRPSIHMPRWASRITLEVTAVKVERLHSISREDAIAEGATSRPNCYGFQDRYEGWSMDWSRVGTHSRFATGGPGPLTERGVSLGDPVSAFAGFINELHGGPNWNLKPTSLWDQNPWIVAVTFTAHRQNIDQFIATRPANPKGE